MRLTMNHPAIHDYLVYLDGNDVTDKCRMADDDEGVVECYIAAPTPYYRNGAVQWAIKAFRDENGSPYTQTEMLRGRVELVPRKKSR